MKDWTEEELQAAVDAYIEMLEHEAAGKKFSKKSYYLDLSRRFDRTEKAFEYRMQNISHVYALQGRHWVSGLKPARNVGNRVIAILERLIAARENTELGGLAEFWTQVNNYRVDQAVPPKGKEAPARQQTTVTRYQRDPGVVAWVLAKAAGVCERCDLAAPFMRQDGTPYLEVHHVQRLVDGGADTIQNAVAICPNCHRELHFGANREGLVAELRQKIARLS